ncbi:hypothetical protein D3C74_373320 [compost metagenome]
MNDRRVSQTAKCDDFRCTVNALFGRGYFIACQNRAQLLSRQREVRSYALQFGNKNFRMLRKLKTGHLGNFVSRLTDNSAINCTFLPGDHETRDCLCFRFI